MEIQVEKRDIEHVDIAKKAPKTLKRKNVEYSRIQKVYNENIYAMHIKSTKLGNEKADI